jgi:cobalamin biosynthesis protein CobT
MTDTPTRSRIVTIPIKHSDPDKQWLAFTPERDDLPLIYEATEKKAVDRLRALIEKRGE